MVAKGLKYADTLLLIKHIQNSNCIEVTRKVKCVRFILVNLGKKIQKYTAKENQES